METEMNRKIWVSVELLDNVLIRIKQLDHIEKEFGWQELNKKIPELEFSSSSADLINELKETLERCINNGTEFSEEN